MNTFPDISRKLLEAVPMLNMIKTHGLRYLAGALLG